MLLKCHSAILSLLWDQKTQNAQKRVLICLHRHYAVGRRIVMSFGGNEKMATIAATG